jgi:membrane protease YdiL (CAAX protease family)
VLDGLRRGHGDGVALMGSATAFALLHPSPLHFLTALLAGLLLGWLRLRTGRVWPCALAHALHNALWFSGGLL